MRGLINNTKGCPTFRGALHPPATPLWLYPNLLGLDAPLVAITWQWFFVVTFSIRVAPIFYFILGLSVWCIYLADRIYDALLERNLGISTDRMRFTFRNLPFLLRILVLAILLNIFLILRYVPAHLIVYGLATAFLLAIYYILRITSTSRIKAIIPREIFCGMLFSLGSAITPYAFGAGVKNPATFWLAVFSLGMVCSAACILISVWERDEDLAVNDSSIATLHPFIGKHLSLSLSLLIACCTVAAILADWPFYASVTTSLLALLVILHFQTTLSKPLLRVLADAILLTPLIFVWFEN